MEYLVKYFLGQKLYIYIFNLHDARKGPNYSCPSNLHITKYIHSKNILHMRQGVKREKKVRLWINFIIGQKE